MPFKEKCPVCRIGWRVRPDVKTCSRACSKEWADWTPEQRRRAGMETLMADEIAIAQTMKKLVIPADEPWAEPPMEEDPAADFLMNILGSDGGEKKNEK